MLIFPFLLGSTHDKISHLFSFKTIMKDKIIYFLGIFIYLGHVSPIFEVWLLRSF
jgi:hypothetical protein